VFGSLISICTAMDVAPTPFSAIGMVICRMAGGFENADQASENVKFMTQRLVGFASAIARAIEFNQNQDFSRAQKQTMNMILRQLEQLENLMKKYSRGWRVTRIAFSGKKFVEGYNDHCQKLSQLLQDLSIGLQVKTIELVTSGMLEVNERLTGIEEQLQIMIRLQAEANANVYKGGDSQSKKQLAKLTQQLETIVEHLDHTVNGKNMEESQKTLEEITKKLESIAQASSNRLSKKLDELDQHLGDKLTNMEGLMEKMSIVIKGKSKSSHARQLVKDSQAHSIPSQEIKHMNPKNQLGKGGFGTVFLVEHEMKLKALKLLDLSELTGKQMKKATIGFEKELAINCQLRHANIAIVYGGVFDLKQQLGMMMEYAPNCTLFSLIEDDREIEPWLKLRLMLDVCYGMRYLHEQSVYHKDLKSLNILLDGDMRAKITDFGLSTHQRLLTTSRMSKTISSNDSAGSFPWVAPERLEDPFHFNYACDMYAFGVVMFETLFEEFPWEGLNLEQIFLQVARQKRRPTYPIKNDMTFEDLAPPLDEMESVVTSAWAHGSTERPTFVEMVQELEMFVEKLSSADQYQLKRNPSDVRQAEANQSGEHDLVLKQELADAHRQLEQHKRDMKVAQLKAAAEKQAARDEAQELAKAYRQLEQQKQDMKVTQLQAEVEKQAALDEVQELAESHRQLEQKKQDMKAVQLRAEAEKQAAQLKAEAEKRAALDGAFRQLALEKEKFRIQVEKQQQRQEIETKASNVDCENKSEGEITSISNQLFTAERLMQTNYEKLPSTSIKFPLPAGVVGIRFKGYWPIIAQVHHTSPLFGKVSVGMKVLALHLPGDVELSTLKVEELVQCIKDYSADEGRVLVLDGPVRTLAKRKEEYSNFEKKQFGSENSIDEC